MTAELTTKEKLDAIEASGLRLAFDGCHKIYFFLNRAQEKDAMSWGYDSSDSYPASEVRELVKRSCGLVFVHPWNCDDDHPWDILQGEDDIFDA